MNYSLNAYAQPLTASQAAHLLRRATFGPTQSNITAFTGVSATSAIQTLINNIALNPAPAPVDLDSSKTTAGQPYVNTTYDGVRNFDFRYYYKFWWSGMMASQAGTPSIVDKLTLFWQNHFVTTEEAVDEYRAIHKYFMLIRNNVLGNLKDFVRDVTKDPAMLKYLNGHDNQKTKPNENYARELQELFVVGAKDFAGNNNYTENDVKAAARVLTGWQNKDLYTTGTTAVSTIFTLSRHDTYTMPKQFSLSYPDPVNPTLGTVINTYTTTPIGYANTGEPELDDLLTMLFRHPETPKFICRKLYRFFVNPNVTQDIETNVIIPLANIFKSNDPITGRAFEIKPIIEKLLASEHFYDVANLGAIVKSPAEFVIGALRFFNFPVPVIDNSTTTNLTNSLKAFRVYTETVIYNTIRDMQMPLIDQPTVFGYDAYFQTGYSKNWINTSQVGLRYTFTDNIIFGKFATIAPNSTPTYKIKIDMIAMIDVTNANHNPTIPLPAGYTVTNPAHIVELITLNLFATELTANQKTFLTATIMMNGNALTGWAFEWNNYKNTPTNATYLKAVKDRLENLMKYILRMAEYNIC
jgi:uncharacterized protein (DUF1800 family)